MEYRVEIISNQSVQDDIIELLEEEIPELEYTVVPVVHGRGVRAKKLGTSTWPEQNFVLFTYVNKINALKIKAIIAAVKQKFCDEGISLFFSQVVDL